MIPSYSAGAIEVRRGSRSIHGISTTAPESRATVKNERLEQIIKNKNLNLLYRNCYAKVFFLRRFIVTTQRLRYIENITYSEHAC